MLDQDGGIEFKLIHKRAWPKIEFPHPYVPEPNENEFRVWIFSIAKAEPKCKQIDSRVETNSCNINHSFW